MALLLAAAGVVLPDLLHVAAVKKLPSNFHGVKLPPKVAEGHALQSLALRRLQERQLGRLQRSQRAPVREVLDEGQGLVGGDDPGPVPAGRPDLDRGGRSSSGRSSRPSLGPRAGTGPAAPPSPGS